MAPTAASSGSTLPSGFAVFTTFPDLLFIFEFVSSWRRSWGGGGMGCAARCSGGSAQPTGPDPQVVGSREHRDSWARIRTVSPHPSRLAPSRPTTVGETVSRT
ncbi:hypothetical protein HPG69_011273 [Diceros bicornis minor]|uniref:Uncharacterized protein n=1 Tax=Diceros bicornis minor TaxID=77932 RepID=A0A7J7FDV9_DICBM|nr:hypothetical protein HPG69_011273 [Diceros bicornis minor]